MAKILNRPLVVGDKMQMRSGVATGVSGAATLNKIAGTVTTAALTTADQAVYTLTLTNNKISADSMVMASVADGTNTQGVPVVVTVKPAAGSVVIKVQNNKGSAQAFNGTLKISFVVVDPYTL